MAASSEMAASSGSVVVGGTGNPRAGDEVALAKARLLAYSPASPPAVDMVRRHPAVVIGVCVAAGFVLARWPAARAVAGTAWRLALRQVTRDVVDALAARD